MTCDGAMKQRQRLPPVSMTGQSSLKNSSKYCKAPWMLRAQRPPIPALASKSSLDVNRCTVENSPQLFSGMGLFSCSQPASLTKVHDLLGRWFALRGECWVRSYSGIVFYTQMVLQILSPKLPETSLFQNYVCRSFRPARNEVTVEKRSVHADVLPCLDGSVP